MRCGKCGEKFDSSFTYCPICGEKVCLDDPLVVRERADAEIGAYRARVAKIFICVGVLLGITILILRFAYPWGSMPFGYRNGDKIIKSETGYDTAVTGTGVFGDTEYEDTEYQIPTKWRSAKTGEVYSLDDEHAGERAAFRQAAKLSVRIRWYLIFIGVPALAVFYGIIVSRKKRQIDAKASSLRMKLLTTQKKQK
jgi:hypothetical protein